MILRIASFSLVALLATPTLAQPEGAAIYADLCASCHADTRLGGKGPALIPENLGRLKGDKLNATIAEGRAMTQRPEPTMTAMPAQVKGSGKSPKIAKPRKTAIGSSR